MLAVHTFGRGVVSLMGPRVQGVSLRILSLGRFRI